VSTKAQSLSNDESRLVFVDVLRGIAVVFMVLLHTAYGWVDPDLRSGELWTLIRSIGGMAAPLFLILAGISLGLKSAAQIKQGKKAFELLLDSVVRGLQLVILGYLLRLQMWMLDGGAFQHLSAWWAAIPLFNAYILAYFGLDALSTNRKAKALFLLSPTPLLFIAGISEVASIAPDRLEGLLRIDVLQAIGASLTVATIFGSITGVFDKRPQLGIIMAIGIAFATPLMRQVVPGPLPDAIAGYLAWWDPGPDNDPFSYFPLFPWMAYVFFGAAIGTLWERARRVGNLDTSIISLSVIGASIALVSC